MKRPLRVLVTILVLMFLAGVWMQFGLFNHREYGSLYIFKKPKLSPKFFFGSPLGESDTPISSLSASGQRAERDYDEFVGAFEMGGQWRWRIMD